MRQSVQRERYSNSEMIFSARVVIHMRSSGFACDIGSRVEEAPPWLALAAKRALVNIYKCYDISSTSSCATHIHILVPAVADAYQLTIYHLRIWLVHV